MSLIPGSCLGSYEVVALIGAGGMGEVYRARDTKLNRDVALKVLADLLSGDPDRLARLKREAQVLAALNHPNIAHIHGFEDSGSTHALVMELVEGPTLADRIGQGPIPLDEALSIARQIADALESAHEHGIVHRDLKPANVKVRDDGVVKVLDFGLAKALDPTAGSSAEAMHSPTLTARATQLGVILGTAAYMAPEQAKGKSVDKRADIWAFGVVIMEMLTGQRAFKGEDISDTLAAVLRQEVDWNALPADTPPRLKRLLERCLERDPRTRLRDIGEARVEIAKIEAASPDPPVVSAQAPPERRTDVQTSVHRFLPWAIAAAATLVAAVLLWLWAPWRAVATRAPLRLSAEIGIDSTLDVSIATAAVISPDGQTMVFLALGTSGRQLFVRKLGQLQAIALAQTEGAFNPFFSPDGQWIGFFSGGKLKKVSVTGGAAVTLCNAPSGRGASWADDDTIIFQPIVGSGVLQRVSAAGGTSTPVGTLTTGESAQRWPQVLPGGKAVLYSGNSSPGGWESANLMVESLSGGTPKVVLRGGFHGRYVRSGHLVYMHEGTLFAVSFDLARLEVTGQPAPVLEGVLSNTNTGGAQFAVSDAGTLVYSPGKGSGGSRPIFWMDHTGATTPLRSTEADWVAPRFSPDGRKLAFAIGDGNQADVWTYEWETDRLTKLTFDPAADSYPVWTPDGRRIAFYSDRATKGVNNLYWQRADGTGAVQRLTESPNGQIAYSFHPSGRFLAYSEWRPGTSGDLLILPIEGDEVKGWKPGTPTVFLSTPANEVGPMFSPDGRWIAYMSDESSAMQVYVRPFPGPGGKWAISTANVGIYPTWSATRPELFFQDPVTSKIMVAGYTVSGDSFQAGKPQIWSAGSFQLQGTSRVYDLHPDGLRVAIAKPPETGGEKRDKVVFVLNFFDEVRRVAPRRK